MRGEPVAALAVLIPLDHSELLVRFGNFPRPQAGFFKRAETVPIDIGRSRPVDMVRISLERFSSMA
jgi:hypothetical protein